jgi:REP element-mobilizing transposase RayT
VGINAKTAPYPAARSCSGGRKRVVGKGSFESYCYHVMSRTCGGEVFFDDMEKEALKRLMWRLADFCGMKLVTYCIMGNHFHLLVEVLKRDAWLERFADPKGEEKLLEHRNRHAKHPLKQVDGGMLRATQPSVSAFGPLCPGFGRDVFDLPVGHRWESGQRIAQVAPGIQAAGAAGFDDRVKDGAALARVSFADEQPVFLADGGGTDGPARALASI